MKDAEYGTFRVLGAEYDLPLSKETSPTKTKILMTATILFAKKGYAAVSVRDIAQEVQVQPASLYNHFASKEELWDAVLEHTQELYLLYFGQLDKQIREATSFEQVLDILFLEPEKMDNTFTNYAFGLVQAEQFRSERAADIYLNIFLKYSVDFITEWFDLCVARGWVPPFDTKMTATLFIQAVMQGINVQVQLGFGRTVPYIPGEAIARLHQNILQFATKAT